MEPERAFRTLMPRKEELEATRPVSLPISHPGESGGFPPGFHASASQIPSLWDYWPIVLRHKWTILSAMVVAVLIGAIISFSTTPIYEAVGRIVINREGADSASLKSSDASADSYDDYMVAMDTQTHVLQSDAIAKLVIRRMNLDSDPSFAGKGVVHASSTPVAAQGESREIEPHQEAGLVGKFHGSLQINSIPRTRLLEIRFSSSDPALAAKAVNTLIDTYIEQNYKTHFDATTRTSDWLAQQLSELQMKVEESQEKLVRYQKEHGILGIDEKENIITSKLDELNKELTAAEGDRMQKESVYRLASSGEPDLLSNIDPSSPIVKLRSQEEDLHRQLAQASVHFQPTYPKVEELNQQLAAVQEDIKAEITRLSTKYEKDYLAALGREKLLRASLENQKTEENRLNESGIEYSLLKRDVESNRQLYEGLLQKLKEAGVMTGLRSSNVRIVDPASAPMSPSSPNIPRNLLMSLAVGLAGGLALAFVMESRDSSVHSLEQVRAITALPSLAVIPFANRPNNRSASLSLAQTKRLQPTAAAIASVARPKSEIAEAYRALRTSILLSKTGRSAKILMVTSALPQEGKTTTSVNLAVVLAQQGARVLLIEADMRRAGISNALHMNSDKGLSTILGQKNIPDPEEAMRTMADVPNLWVLPAGPVALQPSEMLASPRMRDLLQCFEQEFDHIIIDTPPVLSVTDACLLSALADSTLFVIRAGVTSRAALRRAHEMLLHVDARIMGVILNAADFTEPDLYYYGSRYGGYYHDAETAKTAHMD
ncbi:MAG: polysaccharide biosynthesis tyrosine autokinase [Terriglobales bacterium]